VKILPNLGDERVIDALREHGTSDASFDAAVSELSPFAFAEVRDWMAKSKSWSVALPGISESEASYRTS
jgi:hypothetical protein